MKQFPHENCPDLFVSHIEKYLALLNWIVHVFTAVWNANREKVKFSGNLKLCLWCLCTLNVHAQICIKIHMINTFTCACMLATRDSAWLVFCLNWIAIFGSFLSHASTCIWDYKCATVPIFLAIVNSAQCRPPILRGGESVWQSLCNIWPWRNEWCPSKSRNHCWMCGSYCWGKPLCWVILFCFHSGCPILQFPVLSIHSFPV